MWLPDLEPGAGWAFAKFARRHGDYALAGVAWPPSSCWATATRSRARLRYCGVAPTPVRALPPSVAGKPVGNATAGAEAYADAARLAEDVVEAPDDIAASQAFRRHLVNRADPAGAAHRRQRARERSER
ncbi:MAG: hypothetical protein U0S48_05740 [Solirubrobacteraceae bacterium]